MTALPNPPLAAALSKRREHKAPPLECTSTIAWIAALNIDETGSAIEHRKTGIICTLGPAVGSVEKLTELRRAGMNIARLNFSHGSHEEHAQMVEWLRASEAECPEASGNRPIAIALDTKGPEIRLGKVSGSSGIIDIKRGQTILVGNDPAWKTDCNGEHLYIDYPCIGKTMSIGQSIYIDDGNLSLRVVNVVNEQTVDCEAVNNHKLLSGKGVNLPYAAVELPALSEKDKADLGFAVKHRLDAIFASFIRKAEDIKSIREYLSESAKSLYMPSSVAASIKVFAKIENHEGITNFDSILEAADGVMVARGDLGVEIPPEKVFQAQKMMIARANLAGKSVICATQMLESMTANPRPTRAEASDVANAVLDGADCVMLSAETARGQYPAECVAMMSRICRQAEASIPYLPLFEDLRAMSDSITCKHDVLGQFDDYDMTETIASSAVNATLHASQLAAIIVLSTSGHSARLVAKYRPRVPIIVVTRLSTTARSMHFHRGCYPFHYSESGIDSGCESPKNPQSHSQLGTNVNWQRDVDHRFYWAMQQAVDQGLLRPKQAVVCIQGSKGGVGHTNTMRILLIP